MQIFLDNVGNENLGIILASKPEIPTARQVIATTSVPGSYHGSLTQKQGWGDVVMTAEFTVVPELLPGVVSQQGFNDVLRRLNAWAINSRRLVFSDDRNFYRIIKSVEIDSASAGEIELVGTVKVTFTLDPFWYQAGTTLAIADGVQFFNPGTIASDPLITVYGMGTIKFSLNGKQITLLKVKDYLTIDSWHMTVVHGNDNVIYDEQMNGAYPRVDPGNNIITFDQNVSSIEIEGRWAWL